LADQEGGENGSAPGGRAAAGRIVRRLVIVESPTKARKIAGYLGSNYIVESSRGHIRDLPRAAADVPAKYKSEPWARLGVNVDADFEPLYIISPEKKSTVTELKGLLKDVDELYLATDGDREGEAIAWHLLETLKPSVPVKRMVFHEITEPAILSAAENPRDLDIDLVDAQETRRILDRLYGYEVSPVLWKKVAPKLSAGRVQSVATRIIVQRERERMAFRSAGYWDVTAELDASVSDPQASPPRFTAKLNQVDGRRVAAGRDFDSLGGLKKPDEVLVLNEAAAGQLANRARGLGPILAPWPADDRQLTREQRMALQRRLQELGHPVSDFEGRIDFDLRDVIRLEQQKHGMLPDGQPVQLTHDDLPKMAPAFSPDGSRVAYTATDPDFGWNTWVVPVLGGEPEKLLPNAAALTWTGAQNVIFS